MATGAARKCPTRILKRVARTAAAALCLTATILLLLHLLSDQLRYRAEQKKLFEYLQRISKLDATAQLTCKLRDFRVEQLNCLRLISGDASELSKGLRLPADAVSALTDYHYSGSTCNEHLSRLVTSSLSDEERQFPLAFSIMVYKDFDQLLRLLRAIYRPEHYYCLHVDSKANWSFRGAVKTFASCLSNVIIAEPSIDVRWSRYSVLEAELSCWRLLLSRYGKWMYLINLTGQEYPLRTMKELVGILTQLRGANNIENAGPVTSYEPHRLTASPKVNGSSGLNVVWHKGSAHVVVCRGFVKFVFGPVGSALQADLRRQDALRQREPPTDEVLFATINFNSGALQVPGAPADANTTTDNVNLPFLPRYKSWITGVFGFPCLSGKVVRGICIWGLADLPAMNQRFELFANKFFADFQPLTLRCLEERFWHNTLADYGLMGLNKTWAINAAGYSNYAFVRQHT